MLHAGGLHAVAISFKVSDDKLVSLRENGSRQSVRKLWNSLFSSERYFLTEAGDLVLSFAAKIMIISFTFNHGVQLVVLFRLALTLLCKSCLHIFKALIFFLHSWPYLSNYQIERSV